VSLGPLIVASVLMLALGVASLWVARRAAAGTLPRNDLVGIRTAATRASDAAWIAAHRAGAADLRWIGVVALVTAVLIWPTLGMPEGAREIALAVVVLGGAALVLVFSLRAAVVGGRAARAVTDGD